MSKTFRIRRGADIRMQGAANEALSPAGRSAYYAIKPSDFYGVIPKLLVKQGDSVQAGSPLFYDKSNDKILFSSPVSGEVDEIVRGEKRRILEVRIKAADSDNHLDFGSISPKGAKREILLAKVMEMGLWPLIQQRPFAIMANPQDKPKAIFIAGYDSSPMAPLADFVMQGQMKEFQAGVDALNVLADGKPVYLGAKNGSSIYDGISGVDINYFEGPHPAGNVGVQIHKIDPINKGEVVWTINAQDVVNMGRSLLAGKHELRRRIAVTGTRVNDPKYLELIPGAGVEGIVKEMVNIDNSRLISGNVLTGRKVEANGYLGYFDQQITAIPEGNAPQFLLTNGWLGLGFDKFSLSRTFPTWLTPAKKFDLNTNTNGEERAFVVTGEYDKVFPFDILPVYLVKSIMVNDIDMMEKLGIYEVAPEDFALCEYVCTSKIPVQYTVRKGLDTLMEEFK